MVEMSWSRERTEAMERYVAADRSDPFTLARCQLHMSKGIAGFRDSNRNEPMPWISDSDPRRMSALRQDEEAFYGATAHTEMRMIEQGNIKLTFPVTVYRNMTRP